MLVGVIIISHVDEDSERNEEDPMHPSRFKVEITAMEIITDIAKTR